MVIVLKVQAGESVSIVLEFSGALPKGWAQDNHRIEFELFPNAREVDAVLSACAEATTAAPPAAAPSAQAATWKPARTIRKGKTNVRVGPGLDSRVVGELAPGAKVLVQPTSTEWWKVKPRAGEAFSGYIRQDRFVLD